MLNRLRRVYYTVRSAISNLSNPQRWFVELFGGGQDSKAGARVNEVAAVQVTAVFACVRLLGQVLASLPLHTYRRTVTGKEKAREHPLYFVLHTLWNKECTSYTGRLIMMVNLLLTGNAYAEIVRNRAGNVVGLWPIPSNRVMPRRNPKTQEIFYEIYTMDGKTRFLYQEQVLHIQWVGAGNFDSFKPIVLAREAIGLSLAAEEFGSRFFSAGANASGIAEYPGKLSDEAYERFKKTFTEKYTGLSKGQRVMFLEQGLKFTKLTINPNEAQALETRRYQTEEIARFYGVPLHLLQEHTKSTSWGTGLEEMNIGFVIFSLRPYLVCWEQEFTRSIFIGSERQVYYSEFSVEGLLRGDTKARAEFYTAMFNIGVYSQNDIRAKENDNPFEGGDKHWVPLNMVSIEDGAPSAAGGDNSNGDGDGRSRPPDQQRTKKQVGYAKAKLKAAESYRRLFKDAAGRVVKREKSQVLDKARKTLTERSQSEFITWLEEYYRNAPEWMKKMLMPALMTYTETIQALAAEEVNLKAGMTPELEKWMDGYLDIWARDYTRSSLNQILDVIRGANEEGLETLVEIETRLDEWEEKRPGKVAGKEIIAAAGVISKFVYAEAGIRYLRWINAGASPCPFCRELDGKVVGIDQSFLGKNDVLDSEDGIMSINKPAFHPPLHDGCKCVIIAG